MNYQEILELATIKIAQSVRGAVGVIFNGVSEQFWSESYKRIEICFDGCIVRYEDGTEEKRDLSAMFEIGFKTPKGYRSKKDIPYTTNGLDYLTDEQVCELMQWYIDGVKTSSFDPFYAENEARRRNASAWNYVASHYMHDPYDRS